jgi:hypothetical protein
MDDSASLKGCLVVSSCLEYRSGGGGSMVSSFSASSRSMMYNLPVAFCNCSISLTNLLLSLNCEACLSKLALILPSSSCILVYNSLFSCCSLLFTFLSMACVSCSLLQCSTHILFLSLSACLFLAVLLPTSFNSSR